MSQGPALRKYGVETTILFDLFEVDGVDMRINAVDAGADCVIMKDEGAEATCANDFADEGSTYSLILSATEMQAARIKVIVIDQTATKVWLDTSILIETYGNASAQHAMDFNDAVRGGMTALPNAAADAAGGLPISDDGGLDIDDIYADTQAIKAITDALPDSGALTAIGTDTARLTAARAAVLTDWIDAGRLDAILDATKAVADGIQADLSNGTDGLGALKALIDALNDLDTAAIVAALRAETYDGVSYENVMEVLLAALAGVTTRSLNVMSFKKRDGLTEKLQVTVDPDADGVRTVSTITDVI